MEKGSRKIFILTRILAIAVTVVLLAHPTFARTLQATVLKVTDGDTVWVQIDHQRVKLRLLGIDTPEEYHSRKMSRDLRKCHTTYRKMRLLGLFAAKHGKELLPVGEKVTVKTAGRGYYGRTLAWIILPDETNYNEKMVADGYACLYKWHGRKPRDVEWKEWKKLNRLLEKAKRERRGLWRKYGKLMGCLCR